MKRRTIVVFAVASLVFSRARAQHLPPTADVRGIAIGPVALGYHGPCPVMVRFTATVYFTHVPISVRYYWERNGVKTKAQSAKLSAQDPPKLNLSTGWPAGMPGSKFNAAARLHVFTDVGEVVSEMKESPGNCVR